VIILVLGGARSGKSALAERLAGDGPSDEIVYVATSPVADADMVERVAAHRTRRPPSWATVECGPDLDLVACAAALNPSATLVVESLTAWVAGAAAFSVDVAGLCEALCARPGLSIVVSDEVGMGVHPSSEAGRRFRDGLGSANQAVAAVAGEVLLVVAGRMLRLDRA